MEAVAALDGSFDGEGITVAEIHGFCVMTHDAGTKGGLLASGDTAVLNVDSSNGITANHAIHSTTGRGARHAVARQTQDARRLRWLGRHQRTGRPLTTAALMAAAEAAASGR